MIGGIFDYAGNLASDAWDSASNAAGNVWDAASSTAGDAIDWAGDAAAGGVNYLKETLGDAYSDIMGDSQEDVDTKKDLDLSNKPSIDHIEFPESPYRRSIPVETPDEVFDEEITINDTLGNDTNLGLLQTQFYTNQFQTQDNLQDPYISDSEATNVSLLAQKQAKENQKRAEAERLKKEEWAMWDEIDADIEASEQESDRKDKMKRYGTTDLDEIKKINQKAYDSGFGDVDDYLKNEKMKKAGAGLEAFGAGLMGAVGEAFQYDEI